ncbi:kinesin-like protein KIF17 [Brachyistius frenatus]|uniref:kinesin-like protein KIF17 n=1 Tax=Brachyistius frenatus TaxID=100188 RepID=UPI0037E7028A
MATVDMNALICEAAESVRAGVVLTTVPEGRDCVVIGEEGCSVDYKSAMDEVANSFSFDQAVTVDNIESFHPELLQPLTESLSSGFNGALLICGASTETTRALTDYSIIKQVLENLFSCIKSQVKEELFISASFLQFYPDGSAVDHLSLNKQTPQVVTHPVLGGCSSLFSVAVEWELHPQEVESVVCRSRLQLFSLAGGASRTDLRGSVT